MTFRTGSASRRRDGDVKTFVREWAKQPFQVASFLPSSQSLARHITSDITEQTGPVIELGPGTGVFTRALKQRGVAEDNLVLVELNETFAQKLHHDFPKAKVLNISACQLPGPLLPCGRQAGAIVSGLGFLSMPNPVVTQIMTAVAKHLRQGCAMYQFTYGWRCPLPDDLLVTLGLKAERTGRILANFPPASVYRITSTHSERNFRPHARARNMLYDA